MKKSTVGALLLFLLGIGVVGSWFYLKPRIFEKTLTDTSDAKSISLKIRIGGDNYLGYWFITSPELRKMCSRQGISIDFTDDGGAYAERLKKFEQSEYDCIVLPVNSYLEHGAQYKFPGIIVAAISESRGADGIVGFSDKLPTGKIQDMNDASLHIVYTSDSPSSFLLDLTIADFDFFNLMTDQNWRVPVGSSREVLKKAEKAEGDVFVLWESDLSKALALPGMTYLWGSDKFSGYIVDVFVFRRDFFDKHQSQIAEFFRLYFRTLAIYATNNEQLMKEMKKSTDLKEEALQLILKKIEWFDLEENCTLQFGISTQVGINATDGLINTIIACTDVLVRTGKFKSDPLQGNPYLITNNSVIETLAKSATRSVGSARGKPVDFVPLDDLGWANLREVGTMRVEPIVFQSWNNTLSPEGKETVDRIAQMLITNYPNYRVAVRGHTGAGDEQENVKISLERAQVVVQYLVAVHNIDPNRLRAEGVGEKQKPARKPGESERAYRYRLSRVEFVLYERSNL